MCFQWCKQKNLSRDTKKNKPNNEDYQFIHVLEMKQKKMMKNRNNLINKC